MGANWAPGASPGGSHGAEKNSLLSSGGPPEKFPSEISPSQGVPGSALGSILGAPGAHFGPPFGDRRSKCENLNFANSPHENLDFQGSGGLPGGIFGTKNRSKNKLEAKPARTHTPGASKSLPERSWRASGAQKKTLVTSKSGLGKFSSHFLPPSKPTPPPEGGGTPCSAPWFWSIFLENRCWRLGGVQKSRGPGFGGPLLGLGGEAKASPTSKLVV